MGKGNELWDDSALVDAFDRAVSSFKVSPSVSECAPIAVLIADENRETLLNLIEK